MLRDRCPVCDVGVLWPNGWTDKDETWHAGRPTPRHIVLDGDPAPLPRRGTAPQFSAHVHYGQMAGWIKMPLGMEIGLGPGDFVLDEDPAPRFPKMGRSPASPPQKGHTAPQISAHVYCGQTAGWIKMPLDTEVNLGQGDVVLNGVAAPSPAHLKWAQPPHPFSAHVYCGLTAGWKKIPLGKEVVLSPGHTVLDGDPAPPAKGAEHSSPLF